MIIPWLIVWFICHMPPVHPWNNWFVSLLIAIFLL